RPIFRGARLRTPRGPCVASRGRSFVKPNAQSAKSASGGEHESSAASKHRFVPFCAWHTKSTSDSGCFQTNVRTAFDGETRVALEVRRVVASRILQRQAQQHDNRTRCNGTG